MEKVSISLQGGLSNNLFQINTAYAYSRRHNKELILLNQKRGIVHNSLDTYKDNVLKHVIFHDSYNFSEFKLAKES